MTMPIPIEQIILGNESKLIIKKKVDSWINRHKGWNGEGTIDIFTDIEFDPGPIKRITGSEPGDYFSQQPADPALQTIGLIDKEPYCLPISLPSPQTFAYRGHGDDSCFYVSLNNEEILGFSEKPIDPRMRPMGELTIGQIRDTYNIKDYLKDMKVALEKRNIS